MSEVQRPYELPGGWDWAKLEDCVDVLDNQRIPINAEERQTRNEGKSDSELYPYFGATGQVGWIDDYIFDEQLVLLGEDGAPFFDFNKSKAYIINGKSWVNNHAHVLRAIAGATTNGFVCNYLNIFDYHGYVSGTTRHKLNQKLMRKIPVPFPPLPEQRRIVAKIEKLFTQLDAGVSALEKSRDQLKRYRQSVLKAAVEGKLTEEWRRGHPDAEPASVLLERILKERRAKWEEEELSKLMTKGKRPTNDRWKQKYKEPEAPETERMPKLPEGWIWASLDQLSWSAGYGTSEKCGYDFSGPPVLRIPNIVDGCIDLHDVKHAPESTKLEEMDSLAYGDFILIRTNGSKDLVGRAALVHHDFDRAYFFASYLIRYRFIDTNGLPIWVSKIWHSPRIRAWIEQIAATSAGQYNISLKSLNKLIIELPPFAEQREIVSEVERRISVADKTETTLQANLNRAARLRQSILKKAFRGELVPQDPNDEPASVLLERIKAERPQSRPVNNRGQAKRGRGRPRKNAAVQTELI